MGVQLRTAPRRVRPAGPGLIRVRAGRPVIARVVAEASPASVRRDNVDRVVTVLTDAGVDWFRVPCESLTHTAVAVPEKDKDHVLALLRAATSPGSGGLAPVDGRGRKARVWRASWAVTDPDGSLVLGDDFGCEVEFWREQPDGTLTAPRGNPVADVVTAAEEPVVAFEPTFSEFCAPYDTAAYRTRRVFTLVTPERVCFPVDAVVTGAAGGSLRSAMRAVHCFAPWIRQIFLVTAGGAPEWLDAGHPDVTLVSHREIFGATANLPTFNSRAVESRLHRITGMAEHFVHLGHDVLLGRPVSPTRFFTPAGLIRIPPEGGNVPNPARRSLLSEVEECFARRVAETAARRFPHPDDVEMLTSLQRHYAHVTGRVVPGDADTGRPPRHVPFRAPFETLPQRARVVLKWEYV